MAIPIAWLAEDQTGSGKLGDRHLQGLVRPNLCWVPAAQTWAAQHTWLDASVPASAGAAAAAPADLLSLLLGELRLLAALATACWSWAEASSAAAAADASTSAGAFVSCGTWGG